MPVSFNKRRQNEEAFSRKTHGACFSNVRSFLYGKHCFQCQFLFSRYKLCFRYTAGKFNENPNMRALAKFLRARASEHSSNFCEQFEQRPNFASTFELDGTIRHPSFCLAANEVNGKRKKETQWIAKIGSRLAAPARKLAH